MKQTLGRISAILAGLIFISSAVLKIISINGFEIYVYRQGWLSLNFSLIAARLVIGTELLLGIFFILRLQLKFTKRIAYLLLTVFTIFLIIQYFKDRQENCYCFGDLITLTPLESIGKNIFLFILLILIGKQENRYFKLKKFILPLLAAAAYVTPFITSPPDSFVQSRYAFTKEFDKDVVDRALQNESFIPMKIDQGKHLVCFFSTSCQFCKLTAGKISVLAKREGIEDNIVYIFYGKEDKLQQFWDDSHSSQFTYYFIPMMEFFAASGKSLPSVYLVENGHATEKFGYRSLDEKIIENFFRP